MKNLVGQHSISNNQSLIVLWLIIIVFAVTFSALALNRHAAFETNGFDLGNVNQAVWNSAHGRLLAFTNMAPLDNRLALHVEPILLLLVPFYWLGWGGPQLLLVVQTAIVSLGALPLFLIARPKIGDWGALAVATAYLLYPALEAAEMFDFHAVTLAPTFLLFAIYFLEISLGQIPLPTSRRQKSFIFHVSLFTILALMCKEDIGLVVAMLGLAVALKTRRWKPAVALFFGGMVWSLAAIMLVQPLFAAGGNIQSGRYAWLASALTQPHLLWEHFRAVNLPRYFWQLFAPTGGLALLSPVLLLPLLPELAINLLSAHGFQWRPEEFHYAAPMAPFVFLAALETIQNSKFKIQKFYILLFTFFIAATGGYHYFHGFTPLARPFRWRPVTAHQRLGADMVAAIPAEIPLFAPLNLNPHVSSRPVLHQEFSAITPADWLWLDVASLPNESGSQQFIRDNLLPRYETVWATDGYLLLKPPDSSFVIRHSSFGGDFLSFTRPTGAPQVPLAVQFGDSLALTGFDLYFNRAENVRVTTFWRALKPLPADVQPVLFLLDETGAPQGATLAADRSPTLIWYPAEKWQTGDTIAVTFNSVPWESRLWQSYRLAVGVTTAADPWAVGGRWLPQVQRAPFAAHFAADRTLVELARFKQVAGMQEGFPPPRQFSAPQMAHRLDADFGGQVRLMGYDTPQIAANEISVRLVWRATSDGLSDWTRFAQALGADGAVRAQNDSAPQRGTYPTNLWQNGEFVTETVHIALKNLLLPGEYSLIVGLYNPADGERLSLTSGGDHTEIRFSVR